MKTIDKILLLSVAFIFGVCLLWIPLDSYAESTDLQFPTPQSTVDYYKLAFEDNGQIVWVTASYSVGPNYVAVIDAPTGRNISDAVGFGVWQYSDELTVADAYCRITLIGTPVYSNGIYSSPFGSPHFDYVGAYLADGRRAATKLSLGYINESTTGDVSNNSILDFTCYAKLDGTELTDDATGGNLFFCIMFDMDTYSQAFRVLVNGGKVNAGISDTISALMPSAGAYNSPNFSGDIWTQLNTSINNISGLINTYDPFPELNIPAALAAVYNPVIDGALERFTNGSDKITFSLIVVVFVSLVVAFVVTKLRRDAS